jgi:protease-4
MVTARAVRDVLVEIRKAGKGVVVHLPVGTDTKGYLIASGAEKVYAFPGASLALAGFASRGIFLKTALARAGLDVEVLARGKYKSAGDMLSRDEMSEPHKEQTGAILDAFHGALRDGISDGRGLPPEEASAAIDRGFFRTPEALEAKLVDGSVCDPAATYLKARRLTKLARPRACVGVITVHGAISEGGGSYPGRGALATRIIADARMARESKHVRGVVLHVDSPGGSALASARMHRELELLAAEKPLVVLMANVAASGGYYVAAPAHSIVASPLTITGSIGVIAARFAFGPLLARLGVHTDGLKRGEHSDLSDPTHGLSAAERAFLQNEIEGTYQEFLEVVARGRKRSKDEIESLAQGRVWTGADAHARGLVDTLGDMETALAQVRSRIGTGADALEPKVIYARGAETSLRDAKPALDALDALAQHLAGEWTEMLPIALSGERTLTLEPSAMGSVAQ